METSAWYSDQERKQLEVAVATLLEVSLFGNETSFGSLEQELLAVVAMEISQGLHTRKWRLNWNQN